MFSSIKNRIKRIYVNYKRFGLVKTSKYLFYNGIIKRPLNRANYFLKSKNYPQNIIFITSLPKSGSTWLSNMCAEIDGFSLFAPSRWNTYISKEWDDSRWDITDNIFNEFDNNLAVIRGHTWAIPQNIEILQKSKLKYIIGVRDPRDKLISEYYHSRNFPGHWAHDEANKISVEEFITYKLECGEFEKESIEWIRTWLKNRDEEKSTIVKYEDLLNNPQDIMAKLFKFLNFQIDQNEISNIIKTHTFKNVTGRKQGQSDNTKFVRKGIAGEWTSLFSAEQKILFSKIGEDVIESLDYSPTLYNE